MNKVMLTLGVLIVLLGTFWLGRYMGGRVGAEVTVAHCTLRKDMRKLWEDHIVWTRNYIISELANLGDLTDVTNRLLANQVDIGNAIKPVYGDEAGAKLTTLLKEHIVLASGVVKAAKAGNKQELEALSAKWYANADDIAAFLAGANKNWPQADLKKMLYTHLELTTGEATARLAKEWQKDIAFYDKNHDHMLMLADALTNGIVKQFPDKFA